MCQARTAKDAVTAKDAIIAQQLVIVVPLMLIEAWLKAATYMTPPYCEGAYTHGLGRCCPAGGRGGGGGEGAKCETMHDGGVGLLQREEGIPLRHVPVPLRVARGCTLVACQAMD